MLKQINIKKHLRNIIILVFMLGCISFVDKRQKGKECKEVRVEVVNDVENYFMSEKDILELAENRGQQILEGGKLIHIPLKTIENRIESNKFVESVQVNKDHQGNLNISVRQGRPIARFFHKDTSFYIGSKMQLLPLSKRYTSRVVLVDGEGIKNYLTRDNDEWTIDSSLFALLDYIDKDEFYKAQIAGITIGKNGDLEMFPQVTKQLITFGKPEEIDEKFDKLTLFYKTILPDKGWNFYEKVNVKFKDQIICE